MKYILKFELEKNKFKADYRRVFISFFKKAITNYMDGIFYKELYDSGTYKKSLVWTVKFSNPKFQNENLILNSNQITMTIKVTDMQTALIYYSSLLGLKNCKFSVDTDNTMTLKSIKLLKENKITGNFAVFRIFSPICLREHSKENNKDWYYTYENEKFKQALYNSIKIDISHSANEIDKLEFDFSRLKKVIVLAFEQKIHTTIGLLAIKGDNLILNHINNFGIGSRKNSGFGLVETIV